MEKLLEIYKDKFRIAENLKITLEQEKQMKRKYKFSNEEEILNIRLKEVSYSLFLYGQVIKDIQIAIERQKDIYDKFKKIVDDEVERQNYFSKQIKNSHNKGGLIKTGSIINEDEIIIKRRNDSNDKNIEITLKIL